MKKYQWLVLAAVVAVASCAHFKKPIGIDRVVEEKARMDETMNPARRYMIKKDLGSYRIRLEELTVKEIAESNHIDYEFCVIADVQTEKGIVECHIYSRNVKTVAKLVKGESKIDATGMFNRFFTLLDDYYTRLEIVSASISIRE